MFILSLTNEIGGILKKKTICLKQRNITPMTKEG